jgi:hypothetical protein
MPTLSLLESQAGPEGTPGQQTAPVAVPALPDYQPLPLDTLRAGTIEAQTFLEGFGSIALSLAPSIANNPPNSPTLAPQDLQPLVISWGTREVFGEWTRDLPQAKGWMAGYVAACDSAFGVSR